MPPKKMTKAERIAVERAIMDGMAEKKGELELHLRFDPLNRLSDVTIVSRRITPNDANELHGGP